MSICLSVGGSDSCAGAGIQADLATFQRLGVQGCSAITALTAQNPRGIASIVPTDLVHFRAELDAIFNYYDVAVVKTGMLVSAAHIDVLLAALAQYHQGKTLIVDPVLVASSGRSLLNECAVDRLHVLCGQATLVTPNQPEMQALSNIDDSEEAARTMLKHWQSHLLLKGGHMQGEQLEDRLFLKHGEIVSFWHKKIDLDQASLHGTGCRLASAIAAMMMHDPNIEVATKAAIDWLNKSLSMQACCKGK